MQIKATMRYHHIAVIMAFIQKTTDNRFWRGYGEKETSVHCWWEYKLMQPLWETVWSCLKKTKNKITISSNSFTHGISKETKKSNL